LVSDLTNYAANDPLSLVLYWLRVMLFVWIRYMNAIINKLKTALRADGCQHREGLIKDETENI